ncbi:MAG: hypothetical protein WAX14_18855 [Rhodococcus sp. (in: high G+C Gram-positive bacteria)]|uniref:hypothetical protein n=1 Tax=Rhodococcus sp. TaxID=1831 RepID=UPI003BB579AC
MDTHTGNSSKTVRPQPSVATAGHPFGFLGTLALVGVGATGIPSALLTQSAPLGILVALATAACIFMASMMITA